MLTIDEIHNLSDMVGVTDVELVQDLTSLVTRYPDFPDSLIKDFVQDVRPDSLTLSLWIIIRFKTYDLQSVEKQLYTIIVDSGTYVGGELYSDEYDGPAEYMFSRNLCETKYVACHGDKCRRSVDFINDGVWCTSCHGEFWQSMPDQAVSCLKQDVNFTDIVGSDVLYTHVRKTSVDLGQSWTSLDKFVNSAKFKQQKSEFRCKLDKIGIVIQQLESEKRRLLKRSIVYDELDNYRIDREQNKNKG